MRKTLPLIIGLCGAAALAPAMSRVVQGVSVQGSGVRAEERRELPDFEEIHLHVQADVTVSRGEQTGCTVSTDENLLPVVQTVVSGRKLHIKAAQSYSSTLGTTITLVAPLITRVAVNGSGDVRLADVTGEALRLEIAGSGDIAAAGTVRVLRAGISGSGSIDARELEAGRVTVDISGSGEADVHAVESLIADISGSGQITVFRITGRGGIQRERFGQGAEAVGRTRGSRGKDPCQLTPCTPVAILR